MKPLRSQRLAFVRKELDQIGVAVSVVGTSHPMLNKLHGYGMELHDSLHGTREPVRRLRDDLKRALHNLKRVNPRDATKASKAIWAVRDLADQLTKLRRRVKGLERVEPEQKVGRLRLDNVYGYTDRELMAAEKVLRFTVESMGDWGLFRDVVYGDVVLDPEDTQGKLAVYLAGLDAIALDPEKWVQGPPSLLRAFADRIWLQLFDKNQHEVWGGGSDGWGRFAAGFVGVLDGRSVSADTGARLAVTMKKVSRSRRWMSDVA